MVWPQRSQSRVPKLLCGCKIMLCGKLAAKMAKILRSLRILGYWIGYRKRDVPIYSGQISLMLSQPVCLKLIPLTINKIVDIENLFIQAFNSLPFNHTL